MATKTQSTPDNAIKSLAEKGVFAALYGDKHMPVTASYLLPDGRSRQRVWRELQMGGYITDEESGKPFEAKATTKAFDDLMPSGFNLADLYTFDVWSDRKDGGKERGENALSARVAFDNLTLCQRADVIREVAAFRAFYTDNTTGQRNRSHAVPGPGSIQFPPTMRTSFALQ